MSDSAIETDPPSSESGIDLDFERDPLHQANRWELFGYFISKKQCQFQHMLAPVKISTYLWDTEAVDSKVKEA